MQPINWPQIIRALVSAGLTQPQIATACGCGQSTVSDMLKGNTRDPRTSTGLPMLALARQHGIELPPLCRKLITAEDAPPIPDPATPQPTRETADADAAA